MRVRASHECLKKELSIPHDDDDGRGMVRGCVLVTCCVCQVMQARLLYGLYHDGHDDRTHLAMEEERASGHHRPTRHSSFSVFSPRVSGSMDMEGKPSSSITKKKIKSRVAPGRNRGDCRSRSLWRPRCQTRRNSEAQRRS